MNPIETSGLIKSYFDGNVETHVLRGVDLSVHKGEFVAVMGRSGAGKSTLLYQLGLLDEPTGGTISLFGIDTAKLSKDERSALRLSRLGYVFQDYALLPELTAAENVALPLLMQGLSESAAFRQAAEALARVGLAERLKNLPSQLSGGEQQRVSVARAVSHHPEILFADEPTANLDSASSRRVLDIFLELHEAGQTIVMVTHEPEYGKLADRIVRMEDGKVVA